VNLERALPATGRFDGHIVQGHIEGTAEVLSLKKIESGAILSVRIPQSLLTFVVEKGSIALDGVSLTVVSIKGDLCSVALIPHTLSQTTLGSLQVGDTLNLETDVLGRYVLSSRTASGS
jgi:riboflavin synthase